MGPQVMAAITDAKWRERLAMMQDITSAGGAAVMVVALGQMGFQGETLARWVGRLPRSERWWAPVSAS